MSLIPNRSRGGGEEGGGHKSISMLTYVAASKNHRVASVHLGSRPSMSAVLAMAMAQGPLTLRTADPTGSGQHSTGDRRTGAKRQTGRLQPPSGSDTWRAASVISPCRTHARA